MADSAHHSPCWPPLEPVCCPVWDEASPQLQDRAAAIAVEILWALSGRRFGLCELTVRPCGRSCDGWSTYVGPVTTGWGVALNSGGHWINVTCSRCPTDRCRCCNVCEVELPAPAQEIVEVLVDGLAVDPSAYRIDDHRMLVRTDGECWPRCQDLSAPTTAEGTFAVTYTRGMPVPIGGQHAAELYACEIVKSCLSKPCELPERVTSLTREGVTMALLDPMDLIDEGRTGIYLVDSWIRAVNPYRASRPSAVFSPDLPTHRSTTWP